MAVFSSLLKRLALVCVLSLGLVGAVMPAFAQSIVVQGNSHVDAGVIRQYFTGTSPAQVNAAIKSLYATGEFSNVAVSRAHGHLVVRVSENVAINHVAFEGNSKLKEATLRPVVESKSGGAYDPAVAKADVQRLLETYDHAGRRAAQITYRTVPLPDHRVDVVFTINEGDKTGVRDIEFVGNHAFSSGKLRSLMKTTEMNFLSWLKSSDVYDPNQIANDEESIRRFYLKNGYVDFRITGSDARYDAAKKGYYITITLEEGPQYRVSSVNVVSNIQNVDGATLAPVVTVSAGSVYNGDAVQKSSENLTHALGARGFAFSQVHPQGDRDPAAHTIAVHFNIDNGPRVYVERILIEGNTRTRDYVIRREIDLAEGDAFNQVLIDQAKRRLNNLGFFKTVTITTAQGSAPDKVIVDVHVEDKPTGSFSVSGGYSTTDGFLATVSVSESNFLGRGQFVRASASRGQYSQSYELNFVEPYFLGQRISAGVDLFRKQSDISQYSQYQTTVTGGTVTFGLPITEELTFSPRYSLYTTNISVPNTATNPYNDCTVPIAGITPAAPTYFNNCLTNGEASLAVKQAEGSRLTSLVGYSFAYNSLDDRKSPTDGIYATFGQDFAGVGGQSHFLRSSGDIHYYHPIYDDLVGVVHLQAGNITGVGGKQLRLFDLYNMGPTLVRGFAPGGIGPRDISAGIDTKSSALGGTTYFGGSLEMQFPIFGLPREIGLRGAIFADAGTLFNYSGQTNFTPGGGACVPQDTALLYTQGTCIAVHDSHRIRSSLGASIIWASPLGPIRFDFARAMTKDKYDVTQAFQFSGGTSF